MKRKFYGPIRRSDGSEEEFKGSQNEPFLWKTWKLGDLRWWLYVIHKYVSLFNNVFPFLASLFHSSSYPETYKQDEAFKRRISQQKAAPH